MLSPGTSFSVALKKALCNSIYLSFSVIQIMGKPWELFRQQKTKAIRRIGNNICQGRKFDSGASFDGKSSA
jgi:hypothetical protein